MPLQLRTATKDDVPALGRVASKAFHPSIDPIASRLFPPHLRSPKQQDIDGILAYRKARKAIVVDDTENLAVKVVVDDELDGQIVGVAVWELPKDEAPGSAEVGKSKPQAAAPTPPPEMDQDAVGVVKSVLFNDAVEALGKDGVAHVYHLQLIAVDPAQQKRGIGRLLVNWGVQQADERAKKCYLFASEAGRRLYQSAGFEIVKEVPVFGFPHYSMIRRPAETSS